MNELLTTSGLTVGYRNGHQAVPLLRGLDLHIERGRLVALLGRNGAGKSTLLRALSCDEMPIEGRILIDGHDTSTLSLKQRSHLIALVTTERIAVGGLTVSELVAVGRQPHTGFLGRLSSEDRQAVDDAIAAVGMTHKAGDYMANLSDGERQKIMIARALAQQTPFILLDEPTAFLDVASRIEVMKLLRELAHTQNKAVLLSSHDVAQAVLMADDLWLITDDREVITGTAQEVAVPVTMNRMFATDSITFSPTLLDFTTA